MLAFIAVYICRQFLSHCFVVPACGGQPPAAFRKMTVDQDAVFIQDENQYLPLFAFGVNIPAYDLYNILCAGMVINK